VLDNAKRLYRDHHSIVFALIVNDRRIGTDPRLQNTFHDFVPATQHSFSAYLRLVPICAFDLAGSVEDIVRVDGPSGPPRRLRCAFILEDAVVKLRVKSGARRKLLGKAL